MNSYAYEAVNASGISAKGVIEVASQSEAMRRIKEMGLFPIRIAERQQNRLKRFAANRPGLKRRRSLTLFEARVKPGAVSVLTRQIATLVEAGLPLLSGLRILEQQEAHPTLKRIIGEVALTIEGGSLLSEALAQHPKVFNRLYVNMVRAGEVSGALEIALRRLAEFSEKAQRIKGKVKSALYYPVAVLLVATIIVGVMLVFVIPRFKSVFDGLSGGASMPAFTQMVLNLSDTVRHHFLGALLVVVGVSVAFTLTARTQFGRLALDQFKLRMPVFGTLFRKVAIARFARTLGTLLSSGVPVLQALTIVRETAGNVAVGNLIAKVHDHVKEGENMTSTLRTSGVFPPMVVGMVDVGEQTGALPDMLIKIADGYDEEVDNAVGAITSLIEPIMIVVLAVVVGSIVIAMFMPILGAVNNPNFGGTGPDSDS
jgi:type IV pilus assembly protein PilC